MNNPLFSVLGDSIACNIRLKEPVSTVIVTILVGAKVGAWYEHVLGGPQIPNDPDNPIAKSCKGPLMAYLAKVILTISIALTTWFQILPLVSFGCES